MCMKSNLLTAPILYLHIVRSLYVSLCICDVDDRRPIEKLDAKTNLLKHGYFTIVLWLSRSTFKHAAWTYTYCNHYVEITKYLIIAGLHLINLKKHWKRYGILASTPAWHPLSYLKEGQFSLSSWRLLQRHPSQGTSSHTQQGTISCYLTQP